MWISIGLYHSPTKCEENVSPITRVKNPPSTYKPSVPTIGPKILLGAYASEFILAQNSTVYSLYLPISFKNPFPGIINDGSPDVFGKSFVTPEAPKTNGTLEFFATKALSLTR